MEKYVWSGFQCFGQLPQYVLLFLILLYGLLLIDASVSEFRRKLNSFRITWHIAKSTKHSSIIKSQHPTVAVKH
ncbi:hypothetical protein M6B38_419565 [Iris pallida]|uniref:ATP synthase F0 subunit 8 n=1 Tax=Iris pallida TaxID=29817 RepID=A0AAX6FIA8_IRIPA|nr:hypothetical protein M6B38_419565 [Iris pallida]